MAQIIQLIDSNTKENVNYEEVTTWHDGTVMDDSKVDNMVYRKKGGKYYADIDYLAGNPINIRRFGLKCDGTSESALFQRTLDICSFLGIRKMYIDGVLKLRNIILRDSIELIGKNGAKIIAEPFLYKKLTSVVSVNDKIIKIDNTEGIRVGDVISVKGNNLDVVVVESISGNNLTISPNRIYKNITELHTGLKYAHPIGSVITVLPQIFHVTKSLTIDGDDFDSVAYEGGVRDVIFKYIEFRGDKDSFDISKREVYNQNINVAIFLYRSARCNITGCRFVNFAANVVQYYGWNEDFSVTDSIFNNTGYILPTNISFQERDSATGIVLHWDQRFSRESAELSKHVSRRYTINNNSGNHNLNGLVFVSGSHAGIISNNTMDDFVSHGIVVYGGDYGIPSFDVTVVNNIVRNGLRGNDTEALGCGIWLSVLAGGITVGGNVVAYCENGIQVQTGRSINVIGNVLRDCKEHYLSILGSCSSVSVSGNNFQHDYGYGCAEYCVLIDSSLSAYENSKIMFNGNSYAVSSSYGDNALVKLLKASDTSFINEFPAGTTPFADLTSFSGEKRPMFLSCDFSRIPQSGLTSANSERVNCVVNGAIDVVSTTRQFRFNFKNIAFWDIGSTPALPPSPSPGQMYFNTDLNKPVWRAMNNWVEYDGCAAGVSRVGYFANKPSKNVIYTGFRYFCLDRQSSESSTAGIEIIHKGGDVWVDTLGRIVS